MAPASCLNSILGLSFSLLLSVSDSIVRTVSPDDFESVKSPLAVTLPVKAAFLFESITNPLPPAVTTVKLSLPLKPK